MSVLGDVRSVFQHANTSELYSQVSTVADSINDAMGDIRDANDALDVGQNIDDEDLMAELQGLEEEIAVGEAVDLPTPPSVPLHRPKPNHVVNSPAIQEMQTKRELASMYE